MPVEENIRKKIKNYITDVGDALNKMPVENIGKVVTALDTARTQGKRVYIFGNGGSAATASHFASDLSKGAISEGKARIKAFALTDNIQLITAWANDTSYERVFQEQLENYIEAGDVAIAISGSGNSPNVLNGIKVAKEKGAVTIGFSGFKGGKLGPMVDIPVIVPVDDMKQTEDIHLILEHLITACLGE